MSTPSASNPVRVRRVEVKNLARVEGEGALHIEATGDQVTDVRLQIYEPPRFFEAFMRGREFSEAPDLTARICGICPVAYQMSACLAMEDACGVQVGGRLRDLRRLLYYGEWIESHALHIFMLHLPDFLGYESAIAMAADHGQWVRDALALKQAGNRLVALLGGREVHPVNVRVGGFYRLPGRVAAEEVLENLQRVRPIAEAAVEFVAGLKYPELEMPYDFVALRQPDEYAIYDGRIRSSSGLDVPVRDFLAHFEEVHVEHSNALHGRKKDGGGTYLVGPLARINLNFDRLPESIRNLAHEVGFRVPCRNNFKSIVARALETLFAVEQSIEILKAYDPGIEPALPVTPRAGVGHGATEAPRGILYHRYEIGDDGLIRSAAIVPPTAQNQPQIEADLRAFFPTVMNQSQEAATLACEQLIRNYDPCISCATHFLKLKLERRP